MDGQQISRWFAAATVVMVILFMGNRVWARELAPPAQPEETLEQSGENTVLTTPPETTGQEPKMPGWYALCAEKAARVDGNCVFVWDMARQSPVYCSTGWEETIFPASITKLFSAYAALQLLDPETVVTAGYELGLVQPGSSTAFIALDSRLTVEMLVQAMLLPSGNDAAYVLAAAAGRQAADDPELGYRDAVAVFLEEMNRMARELGFENTHFANPDGYHDEDHYSCPADIVRMAELALDTPLIAGAVGCGEKTVTFESGERITWRNTNRLVQPESEYYCSGAVGLKTGYTSQAGYCLLAAFEEGERQILVGIFGGEDKLSRYEDAAELFDACK